MASRIEWCIAGVQAMWIISQMDNIVSERRSNVEVAEMLHIGSGRNGYRCRGFGRLVWRLQCHAVVASGQRVAGYRARRVRPDAHGLIRAHIFNAQCHGFLQFIQAEGLIERGHARLIDQGNPAFARCVCRIGFNHFVGIEVSQAVVPCRRRRGLAHDQGIVQLIRSRGVERHDFHALFRAWRTSARYEYSASGAKPKDVSIAFKCCSMCCHDWPLLSFANFGLNTSPGRYSKSRRLKPCSTRVSMFVISACLLAMESGTAPTIRFLFSPRASLAISCANEAPASTGGTSARAGRSEGFEKALCVLFQALDLLQVNNAQILQLLGS